MADLIIKGNLASNTGKTFSCVVGGSGIGEKACEGDGITPMGSYPLRKVFYRPDKITRPKTNLNVFEISQDDGWSDDIKDEKKYNTLIKTPYLFSHEKLWRDDDVYDIIVVVGFNDDPVMIGKGSAIFLHLQRFENGSAVPTAGCVAFAKKDMLSILELLTPDSKLVIQDA